MVDYILSQDESFIIIQGIRGAESAKRANLDVECAYFKEYFSKEAKNLYHKKAVKKWCETHDASVLRPIFKWSSQDVIDYILENGQQPNPLYKRGFARVGCFPCVMCRKSEIQLISKDEWASGRLLKAEQRMKAETKKGSSFFHLLIFLNDFALMMNFLQCRKFFNTLTAMMWRLICLSQMRDIVV